MRHILTAVEEHSRSYEQHPLFTFLADKAIPAADRLAFAPALSHFVMSFADVYGLVLRDETRTDICSRIVNAHTYEDGGHWRWFLHDLKKLGFDAPQPLTAALGFLWSDTFAHGRLLTYRMCRLGLDASPLQKLVLVECIERCGKVSLTAAAPVADEWSEATGHKLVYLGTHHVETEDQHTVEQPEIAAELQALQVPPEQRAELLTVVERAFGAFSDFATELVRYSRARLAAGSGVAVFDLKHEPKHHDADGQADRR